MKRRKLVRLALLACLVLASMVGFLLWWSSPNPRISHESCEQIQLGMSEEEVIAILGALPNGSGLGSLQAKRKRFDMEVVVRADGSISNWKEWTTDGRAIVVAFDDTGAVSRKAHYRFEETLLDKTRRWLRLP